MGQIDPGMIGIGGLKEKGINLSIAKKLKGKLEEKNYKVVLTREKDAGLYEESSRNKKAQDMQKRISILQEVKPALCISIHQNSYENPEVKGPQVFDYKDSLEGEELAGNSSEKAERRAGYTASKKGKGKHLLLSSETKPLCTEYCRMWFSSPIRREHSYLPRKSIRIRWLGLLQMAYRSILMPLSERATEFPNRLFRRGRFCYTWEKEWNIEEKICLDGYI